MVTLALIPARGGSKGVPGKNLIKLAGRSLIERAVSACLDSGSVDHVVVSTDDADIAAEAKRAGADVPFMRPAELACDDTPIVPVIEHGIAAFEDWLGARVATLVFTEPTAPFRNARHIADAVIRYGKGDCRSVVGVCPVERKPENIFVKNPGQTLERYIVEPRETFHRRQDMASLCRLSSGIYVVGRDDFMAQRRLVIDPVGYIEMSGLESVNIDEEIDLLLAEIVAQRHQL